MNEIHRVIPSIVKTPIVIGAILLLSGCAPIISGTMNSSTTEALVKVKTADYFGVSPSKITITHYNKELLATNYKTTFKGKLYNCSLYYGAVDCKVPGE